MKSKFLVASLVLVSALALNACGSAPVAPQTSAEAEAAKFRPATPAEIRSLQNNISVEILTANPDSLGNARLVTKIENRSGRFIPLLKLSVMRGTDKKASPVIGEAEISGLENGRPVTVSVPTVAPINELVVGDLKPRLTKVWFTP